MFAGICSESCGHSRPASQPQHEDHVDAHTCGAMHDITNVYSARLVMPGFLLVVYFCVIIRVAMEIFHEFILYAFQVYTYSSLPSTCLSKDMCAANLGLKIIFGLWISP